MPSRISAGVSDHPCFLTFYNYVWSLSTVKLLIFLYACIFNIRQNFFWQTISNVLLNIITTLSNIAVNYFIISIYSCAHLTHSMLTKINTIFLWERDCSFIDDIHIVIIRYHVFHFLSDSSRVWKTAIITKCCTNTACHIDKFCYWL